MAAAALSVTLEITAASGICNNGTTLEQQSILFGHRFRLCLSAAHSNYPASLAGCVVPCEARILRLDLAAY